MQPRERSPASTLTPACLPVSLQVQSHPATASTRLTQPESTLAWMLTAQPALPTPRTARPASWQTDTCLDPYTAIPSCVLSAGIPAGYGANSSDNTRVYPCSEATAIACSANASNCSACDFALNGYLLDPTLPPISKTLNFHLIRSQLSDLRLSLSDFDCSSSQLLSETANTPCFHPPNVVHARRQFHPSTV